jgi:hypothetical protein
VGRGLTRSALLAGVLAVACAGTSLAAAPTVRASSGAFVASIPTGFSDGAAQFAGGAIKIQAAVLGPRVNGFTVNINVVRQKVASTSLALVTAEEVAGVKRVFPGAHGFSPIRSTSVSGEPARSLSYLNSPSGRLLHQRQIFVIHNGWAYVITYTASAATQYAKWLPALAQFIAGWHWR